MSLVRVFSDLHLEFGIDQIKKCVDICKQNPTKYIILAGDITNFDRRQILTKVVDCLKPYTEKIIYILGNHEYYTSASVNTDYEIIELYRKLCNELGIVLLENSDLETEDFIFYGATMWTSPTTEAFEMMNDRCFHTQKEIINVHEKSVECLHNYLRNYSSEKQLIVITHHLPSFALIDRIYKRYENMNSGFASNLDHLIKYPVSYWVYGHTHSPSFRVLNGVKMICNPLGYKNENSEYNDCVL